MFSHRLLLARRQFSTVLSTDYVVVGGGSAGCVIASRLSEDEQSRVLLLEAGGSDRGHLNSMFVHMPTALAIPMANPNYNWAFQVEPEQSLGGRVISCPRGKMLGGSSSINGMVYVRGNRGDFDYWEEFGASGWNYQHVLPYFKKAETWQLGEDDYRGGSGPLQVRYGDNPSGTCLNDAFIAAGVELGYPSPSDYNAYSQEGFCRMAMTVFHSGPSRGQRCSTAASYLKLAKSRRNLEVLTGIMVDKIIFTKGEAGSDPRAIGVEYRNSKNGEFHRVLAEKEVILCAGSIQTPHLLQVSGVGDADHLAAINVPLIRESPQVGMNLQDHFEVYFQQECLQPVSLVPFVTNPFYKMLVGMRWIAFRDWIGASNHFEAGAFIRSSSLCEYPDIQFHFLPVAISYDGKSVAPSSTGHSFQLHIGTLRSKARGFIRARTNKIHDPPTIKSNAMSLADDWKDLRAGIRIAREVIKQPSMKGLAGKEISPGPHLQTDEELDGFIRSHIESAYHPCGTCVMGNGPNAVVDCNGLVYGVEGLRIADASVMPRATAGNLNAPVIMIAEKIADAIKGRQLPEALLTGQA